MSKKKEWLFQEFWEAIEKFNELAETGRYSSLSEIYKKLAEDFKCTEEDVLSAFNSLNDEYDQLVEVYEALSQSSLDTTPDEIIDTLSEEFETTTEDTTDMLKYGIENSTRFVTTLKRWKKFFDERRGGKIKLSGTGNFGPPERDYPTYELVGGKIRSVKTKEVSDQKPIYRYVPSGQYLLQFSRAEAEAILTTLLPEVWNEKACQLLLPSNNIKRVVRRKKENQLEDLEEGLYLYRIFQRSLWKMRAKLKHFLSSDEETFTWMPNNHYYFSKLIGFAVSGVISRRTPLDVKYQLEQEKAKKERESTTTET